MTPLKVLIASKSLAVCAEIAQHLTRCSGVQIVGFAHNGQDIVRQTQRQHPDLLILHVPGCGYPTVALFQQLRQAQPQLRTLAVGCSPEHVRAYFLQLTPWGLSGCICQLRGGELRTAVRTLQQGASFYLCPRASQALIDAYRRMTHHWSREEA
ncbi:MAG: response regulator transcription factor [Chloroflexi bacterium]|nr:response regulator transcription factor [Chloroflexota bacterium]